eukprot:Nitzschia sp. Nitz4//scaffold260_size33533//31032//33312//NITZ4_007884-RA/size33533-augustus-gene-0.47-mRNA-1//1//CDS//3329544698//882//frame0
MLCHSSRHTTSESCCLQCLTIQFRWENMTMDSTNGDLKVEVRSAMSRVGLRGVSEDLLSKCVALASTLHVSPEQMATCWEAYSLTKSVNELTDHTFEAYKTEVYKQSSRTPDLASSTGAVMVRSTKRQPPANMVTPPDIKRQRQPDRTPHSAVDAVASDASSPQALPVRTPSFPLPKYDERPNPGKVVASYNPKGLPSISHAQPPAGGQSRCVLDTSEYDGTTNVTQSYRHMFSAISDRSSALEDRLLRMTEHIISKYGIGDGQNGIAPLEQVNVACQEPVCCIGRICNEAHQGRLNSTSVVLEGTSSGCGGARINVDLSQLQSNKTPYSLYPGQIVGIEGLNPTGRKLVATRILEGAPPAPEQTSVRDLRSFHYDKQDGAPLRVMTACGPFTTSDNTDYAPLQDLLMSVIDHSPDVLILTGPFVDLRQPLAAAGTIQVEDQEITVSHEAMFAYQVSSLISQILEDNKELQTQFVLVPSLDDATAKWVYPQPPLKDRYSVPLEMEGANGIPVVVGTMGLGGIIEEYGSSRIHCLSNPCTFKLNEVVVGVTSTDVVFHTSIEETNGNLEPGSRLRRISQSLLQQRSYYPLFPPPLANPTNLELSQMKNFEMPCIPDVCIIPSKLSPFASNVQDGTVMINPGHLSKGTTGGTYGIFEIHPMKRESLEESGDNVVLPHGVQDRVNVEVRRI